MLSVEQAHPCEHRTRCRPHTPRGLERPHGDPAAFVRFAGLRHARRHEASIGLLMCCNGGLADRPGVSRQPSALRRFGQRFRTLVGGILAPIMPDSSPVVHSDPEILGGTPVFVGTRVPVQSLFDYLEAGDTLDEFLRQFPSVRREQAVEALEIARRALLTSARPA